VTRPRDIVLGLDLSGPSNIADTAAVVAERVEGHLRVRELRVGLGDAEILALAESLGIERCVFAIDAPLSYNPGGGDRPSDRQLRQRIVAAGLASGSVMPPTMNRMAYLTLRGMAIARLLSGAFGVDGPGIVEVHPGATMVLRGAEPGLVRGFAREPEARRGLLAWLRGRGLPDLDDRTAETSHGIAAAAAVLAGADWLAGSSEWRWPAEPPHHPYDFAC
jgi:uncharacterized protein